MSTTIVYGWAVNEGPPGDGTGEMQSSPTFKARPETEAEIRQNALVASRACVKARIPLQRVKIDYYGSVALVTFCDGPKSGKRVAVSAKNS